MIKLKSCPKGYDRDLDKVISPQETVLRVKDILRRFGKDILLSTRRIDTGRLGIPVFFSEYGEKARAVCPRRKQMGKGASVEQAEASALMELVERYSFFSFWESDENFFTGTFSEAKEKFRYTSLISEEEILKSVDDNLDKKDFSKVFDLVKWRFCRALLVKENKEIVLPADWFKVLNEYNGSSAGNTFEESILQGACELVERHVSAIIDRKEIVLPTIDLNTISNTVLKDLISCFVKNNIKLWLKDFSMGMGVPTVGALAYDPSTFPEKSEIVFTAGCATSPDKAAIRALTEVAQLAGDFCTNSRYEPSGLRKFDRLEEARWVMEGELVDLTSLPDISNIDIYVELNLLSDRLRGMGYNLYSIDTTHPEIGIPCNYNIVPGFLFRERTKYPSVGLFVGRLLVEKESPQIAEKGLIVLEEVYPDGYFIPFFKGQVALKRSDFKKAMYFFENALDIQPGDEEKSLVLFYMAWVYFQQEKFEAAIKYLNEAISLVDDNVIYFNLRGTCKFKLKRFEEASFDFKKVLDIDRGSAMDLANLGMCYKMMGNREYAISCFKDALELDPTIDFAREQLRKL